jgi:hypothetical protein
MVEIVEFPVKGQLVLGQANADRLVGLAELLHPGFEIDAVEADLDRRDAAADPVQKAAVAQLVEHTDLIDQPKWVVERQEVNHRAKFEPFGALRDRRKKHARRRRVAQRRVVMLGEVVGVKPEAVVSLDQPQALFEMPGERQAAVVEVVENPEAHGSLPRAAR